MQHKKQAGVTPAENLWPNLEKSISSLDSCKDRKVMFTFKLKTSSVVAQGGGARGGYSPPLEAVSPHVKGNFGFLLVEFW